MEEPSIQHPGFKNTYGKAPFVLDKFLQQNVYSAGVFPEHTIRRDVASLRNSKTSTVTINSKNNTFDRLNCFIHYASDWGRWGKYAIDDKENEYDRWKLPPHPIVDKNINYMSSKGVVSSGGGYGLRTGGFLLSSFMDTTSPVKSAV